MLRVIGIKMVICSLALVALSACASKKPLTPSAISAGPDEFSITPAKPLESPDDFSVLPAPTLGGTNLTDATPNADAIIALGGRVPVSGIDGGIVTYASRYGVDPAIRAELSLADTRFLKRKSATPSFPWVKNKYERAYRRLALDPWAEAARLRDLGVQVPSYPPLR